MAVAGAAANWLARLRERGRAVIGSARFRAVMRLWVVQFALLAAGFWALRMLFHVLLRQREDIYFHGFLGIGFASRGFASVLCGLLFALVLWRGRRVAWGRVGRAGRIAISAVLVTATWCIVGVGFNYYTGQAYLLDRALILALLGAALWRPSFTVPLLGYLLVFLGQHHAGAGDWELTDKFPILDALVAFIAWMVLRCGLPMRARALLWFLLALQAVNYLAPGIAKLSVGGWDNPFAWYTDNPLHVLPVTAWVHGWLPWMSESDIVGLANFSQAMNTPMRLFTLAVELGAPLALLSRRTTALWLVAAVALHGGIFAMTGILFWIWCVLDLALLYWLWRTRRRCPRGRSVALLVLVAAYPLYAVPKNLGWLDTPVCEHYFIEVQTGDGVYRVDQADFSPFDVTFEQGALHYINPAPVVTYSWDAALDYPTGTLLNEAATPEDVEVVVRTHGQVKYDDKRAKGLDEFLATYFANANAHGDMRWVRWVGPPTHMQARSGEPRFQFDRPVRRVHVRFIRTFFDGERILTLEDRVLRQIDVP